jgi:hypothetical protein
MKKAWDALLSISTGLAALLALSASAIVFMLVVLFAVAITKILIFIK